MRAQGVFPKLFLPHNDLITFAVCLFINNGVSRLGAGLATRLETHFWESQSRRLQVSVTSTVALRLSILKRYDIKIIVIQRVFCLLCLQETIKAGE